MKRAPHVFACVLVVLCITAIGRSAFRYAEARSSYEAVERATTELNRQAGEIIALRATQQRIELHQRPAQDLIARVNAIMAELHIASKHFKGLNPESDVIIPSGTAESAQLIRRQTVRIALQNLEPAELGRFLAAWKRNNPIWQPTRIDLTHTGNAKSQENRYDAVLLLSALYLGEQEPA